MLLLADHGVFRRSMLLIMLRRVIYWIIGLLLASAVIAWLGWLLTLRIQEAMVVPEDPPRNRAVAVEVVDVQYGTINDRRRFTGTLRPLSRVDIAARIGGRLERVNVDIGDRVKRNDVIAEMDNAEFEQDVAQAAADLMVTQATLQERRGAVEMTRRDFDRAEQLRQQGIASEAEFDTVRARLQADEAAVKVAEAELSRREAALQAARVRLSYTVVRAAWEAGVDERVVSERSVDEGATLSANMPIVTLLDVDRLIAVIYVTERDYTPLRTGMQATIMTDSQTGSPRRGTIVRMAPAFQEGSRQARIEIEVDNRDFQFRPGMFVRVELELGSVEHAAIIPRQAILTRGGVEGIYVVETESMTAKFVPVRLGIVEGQRVQILEPELTGPVVTLGQHLLSPDSPVTLPETPRELANSGIGDS